MSKTQNQTGSKVHAHQFAVFPVSIIDEPIGTSYFYWSDGLDSGQYSIKEHERINGRKIKYTTDRLYAVYGVETSDLKNDTRDLKTFMKQQSLVLGGEDFTTMAGNEFWMLSYSELLEWLNTSPHNVTVEIV